MPDEILSSIGEMSARSRTQMPMTPNNNSVRLAIDVGGTFTDAITLTADGVLTTEKSLTTAHDVAHGCAAVVDRALAGTQAETIVVHGTTLTLNAVVTKRYRRTALITTAGFRDVLEIMRGTGRICSTSTSRSRDR